MFAVFVSSGSGSTAVLMASLLVLALGFSPLLDWLSAAWRSQATRRIVGAVAFAIILSLTMGAKTAYAVVINCDWYSVLWWLCG